MAAAVGACVSRALEAGSANVSEEGSGAELEVDVPEAGSLAIEEPAVGSGASRAWAHGGEEPPPCGWLRFQRRGVKPWKSHGVEWRVARCKATGVRPREGWGQNEVRVKGV